MGNYRGYEKGRSAELSIPLASWWKACRLSNFRGHPSVPLGSHRLPRPHPHPPSPRTSRGTRSGYFFRIFLFLFPILKGMVLLILNFMMNRRFLKSPDGASFSRTKAPSRLLMIPLGNSCTSLRFASERPARPAPLGRAFRKAGPGPGFQDRIGQVKNSRSLFLRAASTKQ